MGSQSEKSQLNFVGVDVGTSGCRAIAIDDHRHELCSASVSWPMPAVRGANVEQNPATWWQGLCRVLRQLREQLGNAPIVALAIDATSGTTLLADESGRPLSTGLMYNDTRAKKQVEYLAKHIPFSSPAQGPGSGLAKFLWLLEQPFAAKGRFLLHQGDWLTGKLSGRFGISDENNALKSGYDPVARDWPAWIKDVGLDSQLLPRVYPAGTPVGQLDLAQRQATGLDENTLIVTGTTDSTAAFIATGAAEAGDAVTSLGSTLVLKVVSPTPVFSPADGVYSHRLDDMWLVGGASNSGGAVLRQFFSDAEMDNP